MLWAAIFLGFLHSCAQGEFARPSWEAFTPDMFSLQDLSVNSQTFPSHLAIHLKRRKNDLNGMELVKDALQPTMEHVLTGLIHLHLEERDC